MSDQPFNLFDLSAKSGKKKPEKEKRPSPNIPTSPVVVSNDEVEKMLKQMKKMHSELSTQIDVIFEKSGQDPKSFSNYFNNPSNFQPDEWTRLQQRKAEIESQILGKSKGGKTLKEKKLESKATKERKGKTLGARKKWIDMR